MTNESISRNVCTCSEELVTCENCEKKGCSECDEGWSNKFYQDEDGLWFCPQCLAEIQKQWEEQTENGKKVCESCKHYSTDHPDLEDWPEYNGLCEVDQEIRGVKEYCKKWHQLINNSTNIAKL